MKEKFLAPCKGMRDYYAYYKKHRPEGDKYKLSEGEVSAILNKLFLLMSKEFADSGRLHLPASLGTLTVITYPLKRTFDDTGKLIYKAPINWHETLLLWAANPEAAQKKQLVHIEDKEWFSVIWSRSSIKNRAFYKFRVQRSLFRTLRHKLADGTLISYKDKKWNSI